MAAKQGFHRDRSRRVVSAWSETESEQKQFLIPSNAKRHLSGTLTWDTDHPPNVMPAFRSSKTHGESIVPVLHHPRCMNCHSRGDFPRQGDDEHRHAMNVRRGPEGDGVTAVKCSSCHQDHNTEGLHTPPGAPDWRLPSPAMPMIWEGLTDRQLCELFKDPQQNGGRDVDGIVEHMNTPLVLWGWHPGEGRAPIPVPRSEFIAKVKDWAAKGAACPGETTSHP